MHNTSTLGLGASDMNTAKRWGVGLMMAGAMMLTACSQAATSDGEGGNAEDNDAGLATTNTETGDQFANAQMPVMSQTAWRVLGEDGAIYTTFFDENGDYRDFKNGEAAQNGSWNERADGQLCFTPADETRIGDCWKLSTVSKDGIMKPVSDAGKVIDLRQVTYIAPAEMQQNTGN